jgi:serine/threonine protein kinase
MAHAHTGGAVASPTVAGLLLCDRSKINFISTTPPQEGGCGIVYHAHMNGIEVAVKFPKMKIALNPRELKRFEREIALQAKVRHPHCVQIMAGSLNPSDPFIVMEWVPGRNWFDKLASDPPPPAHQRIRAVREMSSGLQYLHDPLIGIVHGDVKSLNMLLLRDGSSKFCDFGGAVQVLSTAFLVSSASGPSKVATRAFSAPELFKGEPKSPATDMYAFGILLWEFAACDVPFADNPDLICDQVLRGIRPRIPSPRPEDFPADYFKLMEECWSDDPRQRPSAEQAHKRLLKLDHSARPVQGPIALWHPAHTRAPASLLRCILTAMQALPGQINAQFDHVFTANVADAAQIVSGSPKVQQLMRQYRLTEIEAQTVSVYTTDACQHGGLREQSIFFHYNAATRSGNPHDVELWSEFSFLFCKALEKLPSVHLTVFRGLDLPLTQLSHQYTPDGTVWLSSVTSTTTDKAGTLLLFGTGANGRPGTLLQINAVDAKNISDFSMFKTENEYIIPPNSCHKVKVALSSDQASALSQFGALPNGVDLIVMDQQKCDLVPVHVPVSVPVTFIDPVMDQQKCDLVPVHVPVSVPVTFIDPAPLVLGCMSPSEFEAAVSDQSAARHAYLDSLQAALPVCEAAKQSAKGNADYDGAARFSEIAMGIRAILSGIEKPRSKADIRASLDGGIIAQMEQAENARRPGLQLEIDLARSDFERSVLQSQEAADRKTAQLLERERTAADKDDFTLAQQIKVTRELSIREGQSAVNKVQTEGGRLLEDLQARLSAIALQELTIKQLERQARAILSFTPKMGGQDLNLLRALLKSPRISGYDAAAFSATGCDPAIIAAASYTIVYNGHFYKSLGEHDPHSIQPIDERGKLHSLDSIWQLCPNTPDALHVCSNYTWAAAALVFADGSTHCTALDQKCKGKKVISQRLRHKDGNVVVELHRELERSIEQLECEERTLRKNLQEFRNNIFAAESKSDKLWSERQGLAKNAKKDESMEKELKRVSDGWHRSQAVIKKLKEEAAEPRKRLDSVTYELERKRIQQCEQPHHYDVLLFCKI